QPRPALAVARRRTAGLGGLGVRGASPPPPRVRAGPAGLHPSSGPDPPTARGQSGGDPHSRPRPTSPLGGPERLRLHEGALSRAAQESPSARGGVGAREPVHDAKAPAALPGGVIRPLVQQKALYSDASSARPLPTGFRVAVLERLQLPRRPST